MASGMQDTDDVFEIKVEMQGASDCTGAPVAFSLGSRRVVVQEIQDRWIGADHCYFRLIGADDALYILRHNEDSGRWAMTLFKHKIDVAPPPPGAGLM